MQAKTGPKRRVDLRAVRNGLLSKLKSGCQWEVLPRSFPPKSTVHDYFQKWTQNGILVQINDALRRRVRVEVEGREHVEATGGVSTPRAPRGALRVGRSGVSTAAKRSMGASGICLPTPWAS